MDEKNINNLFRTFINDIIKVFPEYQERLHDEYEDLFLEEEKNLPDNYLSGFLKKIRKYNEEISNKDEDLFKTDPIIIPNVSFKMMWNSGISKKTKNTLWRYLISFCAIEIKIRCGDKIDDVLKSIDTNEKVKDKKTVEDMKKLKKLNELLSIKEIIEEEENIEDVIPNDMENLLKNTNIGKIAQEITEDLDIESMFDPTKGIENMFQGDSMMNIFTKINSKIEGKLSNNEINRNDLLGEAQNICGSMQGNPLFGSLMENMGGNLNIPQKDVKNINFDSNNPHNSNKTKKRLQKKLNDKNSVNVEKISD